MSERKKYIHEENKPLTKYATTKFRKIADNEVKASHQDIFSEPCSSSEPSDDVHGNTNFCLLDAHSSKFNVNTAFDMVIPNNDDDGDYNLTYEIASNTINDNTQIMHHGSMETSNVDYDSDDELLKILESRDEDCHKNDVIKPEFFNELSLNVKVKPAEILLIALKYALSQRLPIEGLLRFLKVINHICGTIIVPETKYFIDKTIKNIDNVTLHGVCPLCLRYLGIFKELGESVTCKTCDTITDVSNPSSPCFFAFIDPSSSIKHYLEFYEDYYDYVVSERKHDKNHIRDIFDGKLYVDFVRNLGENRNSYVTAVFNTDGAPVFKSSKYSIWPLYLILNEIPVQARLKSSIVCGLWFGANKPDMSAFLEIFVENMNKLSSDGISCNIKQQNRNVHLYCIVACVDSVARAPMNGTIQFNGKFGCDWCLHPGQFYGGSMRYPFLVPPSADRNKNNTIQFAQEAIIKEVPVYGVKNASPLFNLHCFDIITGFVPDYMHCYLSGVAVQFTELIVKKLTTDNLQFIDELLQSIKAPHHIGRLSRPLSQRDKWKSREWENWILYYSIPVLEMVVDRETIEHWVLLVEPLHICLQMDISLSDLNRANEMLHRFVYQVEDMYLLNNMTYNVHMLLHIVKSCYDWGPLWAHSTFPFESANHNLLTAIHCAKGVILQIIRFSNMQHFVQRLEKQVYPNCSGVALDFFQTVLDRNHQNILKISSISYLGRGKIVHEKIRREYQLPETTIILRNQFSKAVYLQRQKK